MYKLLVVDDEYNIRDGIVNAVPWQSCDVEVVGEACNGVEALAVAQAVHPDVVISDITMDEMDGLEFTERLRTIAPATKFIIISGYDEFEFAKRALQLKVSAYLLKPVLPDELIQAMRKVITEIQAQAALEARVQSLESELMQNQAVFRDRLMQDLISGAIQDESHFRARIDLAGLLMPGPAYCCVLVSLDHYFDYRESVGIEQTQLLVQKMHRLAVDLLGRPDQVWTRIDSSDLITLMIGFSHDSVAQGFLNSVIDDYREQLRRILGVTATLAVGSVVSQITDLARSYREAQRALEYRVIAGTDTLIQISDIQQSDAGPFDYPQEREDQVLGSLIAADETQVRESISHFFAELTRRNFRKEQLRIAVMQLLSLIARKFMDQGIDIHGLYEKDLVDPYKILERFDTIDAIKNWMTNVAVGCLTELNSRRSNTVSSVVSRAQEYIAANFTNPDISLQSIAEHAYLSPTYLSKLYKNKTGETYLEFLTRLRIDKACQLLRQTNSRASEIGQAVGYPNAQYFTTLFRKVTGKTPLEFRSEA